MLVPNRHGSSNSYRYGFQGQEKDDELKGEGNSLNYTFRMHDPRVGRFFARDPLEKKYPYLTPYQFSSNQPIHAKEFEGLESSNELKGDVKNEEMPFIQGKEVVVTNSIESPSKSWSSEVGFWDRVDQGNTPVKIDYKQKAVSHEDEVKRMSRDRMTKEQTYHFKAAFAHGGSTGTYADPLVGVLAVGVTPVVVGSAGPIIAGNTLKTALVKSGISSIVQYSLSGNINVVTSISDGVFVPGASAFVGSAFEVNIDFNTGTFNTKSIFGSGAHAKSIEDFTIEASTSYMFGSANGYFGRVINGISGAEDDLARHYIKGVLETTIQTGNLGTQNELKGN